MTDAELEEIRERVVQDTAPPFRHPPRIRQAPCRDCVALLAEIDRLRDAAREVLSVACVGGGKVWSPFESCTRQPSRPARRRGEGGGVMSELKACPFCGGDRVTHAIVPRHAACTARITCRDCGAMGPASGGRDRDIEAKEEASVLWNLRTPLVEEVAGVDKGEDDA